MTNYGLTAQGAALALQLAAESGDDVTDQDAVLEGATSNHSAETINAAADGDHTALMQLRDAFGLPIFR